MLEALIAVSCVAALWFVVACCAMRALMKCERAYHRERERADHAAKAAAKNLADAMEMTAKAAEFRDLADTLDKAQNVALKERDELKEHAKRIANQLRRIYLVIDEDEIYERY